MRSIQLRNGFCLAALPALALPALMLATGFGSAALAAPPAKNTVANAPATTDPTDVVARLLALQANAVEGKSTDLAGRSVRLIGLSGPTSREWLVGRGDTATAWLNLETRVAGTQLALTVEPAQLLITDPPDREGKQAEPVGCPLEPLFSAAANPGYAAMCGGRVFLRRDGNGFRTNTDIATDGLRAIGPLGEKMISLYKAAFPVEGVKLEAHAASADALVQQAPSANARPPAAASTQEIDRRALGIPTPERARSTLVAGRWYAADQPPGVFVSIATPDALGIPVAGDKDGNRAISLIAFDMSHYTVSWHAGVHHPKLNWSDRSEPQDNLPGPDGLASTGPYGRTGIVPPDLLPRLIATFTGGYKRQHGAITSGPIADKAHPLTYGFMERGVVLSKLQPQLATLYVREDGVVHLDAQLPTDLAGLVTARQNGVPLVSDGQVDPRATLGWGNWSGDMYGNPITMRSGVCMIESEGNTFLAYAWFSRSAPSTMAHVFAAYHCRTAMQLDMNSANLTYAALYKKDAQGQLQPQHLDRQMTEGDPPKAVKFVNHADTRDFFAVVAK